MKKFHIHLGAALLGGLASCAVGPDYQKPALVQTVPADWHWKVAEPQDAAPKGEWWAVFRDDTLARLETNAVANNQNLRAALARVDQARAAARMARSQYFPELSLDPGVSRQRVSGNEPLPFPVKLKPVYLNTFEVPLDLSYEVDLWGRVRRTFESAHAQAQASAADFQNVRLTLTADVAVNYFLLRALDRQTAALNRVVELRQEAVRILNARATAGTLAGIEAAQAAADLAATQSDLADLARQRAETVDALALLCGQPASTFTLAEAPSPESPPLVPVGVPSSVLERRPDISSAERTLAAKNAQIGAARAAYFPVVRLTGQAGYLSGEAKNLFDMNSLTFSLGPSASLPIFTGGRTAAEVRQARSAYQESVANYQQSALTAFKEVEDSLAQINFWNQQALAQNTALAAARRVSELTQARADAGVLTELEAVNARVLESQQEEQIASLSARRFAAAVRLVKALGGGWDDTSVK